MWWIPALATAALLGRVLRNLNEPGQFALGFLRARLPLALIPVVWTIYFLVAYLLK
jgi:hypothetical protein